MPHTKRLLLALVALLCAATGLAHAQNTSATVPYSSNSTISIAWTSGTYYQGDIRTYSDGCSYLSQKNGNTDTPGSTGNWAKLGCTSGGAQAATTSQSGTVTLAPGASAVLSKAGSTGAFGDIVGSGITQGRVIYQQSTWSNLNDFTVDSANVSASVSNGQISVSGSGGSLVGYLAVNATQAADENVDLEVIATVNSTPGGSGVYGISVGKVSQDSQALDDLAGFLALDDTPVDLKWLQGSGSSTTTPGSAVPVGTVASGDLIRLVYSQRGNVYTTIFDDYTQGTHVTNTVQSAMASPYGVNAPNSAKLGVWVQGGSYTISSIKAVSRQPFAPNLAAVGDSKTWGFNAVAFAQRFASLIEQYGPVATYGGQADETAQTLADLPYIIASKPKQVLLCIGYNDIGFGVATSTWQSNYAAIVNQLQAAGIPVFHLLLPSTPNVNVTALNNYINGNYPASNIISVSTVELSSDSTHPDAIGHAQIAAAIVNSGKLGTGGAASASKPLPSVVQFPSPSNAIPTTVASSGSGAKIGLVQEQAYSATGTIANGVDIALVTATATMTLPSPANMGNASGANLAGDLRVVSLPLSSTAVTTTVVPGSNATLNVAGSGASSFTIASGMTAVFTSAGTNGNGGGPSWFVTGYYPTSTTSAGGCTSNCTFTGTTVSPTFANSTIPTAFAGTGAFISGNSGQFTLYNAANGTDQKAWDFAAYSNGALLFRAVNDANTAASTYLEVDRSGTTITAVKAPNLQSTTGYNGTKTAGSCTFTIVGGVITAVSGC